MDDILRWRKRLSKAVLFFLVFVDSYSPPPAIPNKSEGRCKLYREPHALFRSSFRLHVSGDNLIDSASHWNSTAPGIQIFVDIFDRITNSLHDSHRPTKNTWGLNPFDRTSNKVQLNDIEVHDAVKISQTILQLQWAQNPIPKPPDFQSRILGSFEKMLAKHRNGSHILSTPHVWTAIIDGDISFYALHAAVVALLARHPMLRASIQGTGLPKEVVLETIRKSQDDDDPLIFIETKCSSLEDLANFIITPQSEQRIVESSNFDASWMEMMEHQLEHAEFRRKSDTPNWRVEAIRTELGTKTALIFTMNHAIEDQKSANTILSELLVAVESVKFCPSIIAPSVALKALNAACSIPSTELPSCMESAIVNNYSFGMKTLQYIAQKAMIGLKRPTLVHDHFPIEKREKVANEIDSRRTICEFRILSEDELSKVLAVCKEKNLTLTSALSAAALLACSDVSHSEESSDWRNYKFLLAVDLRRFGRKDSDTISGQNLKNTDWTNGSIACAGGAMDWVESLPANTGRALLMGSSEAEAHFWRLAERCRREIGEFISNNISCEAVAVFDWGMKTIEIGDVCEREARNPSTLGRAYTCGVSNMGRYMHSSTSKQVEALYYATSHSPWGSLYQLSCGTVGDRLCMTFQFVDPIVDREMGRKFADAFLNSLLTACNVKRT